MFPKVYTLIWVLAAIAGAVLYFTGYSGELIMTVFGLMSATLFFGFFVAVLPWLIDRHFTWKY